MLGGALVFSRGSKSERHLRKKINPAVTHSAVADPANSRHLKKSLEARHLPGDEHPSERENLSLPIQYPVICRGAVDHAAAGGALRPGPLLPLRDGGVRDRVAVQPRRRGDGALGPI